MNYNDFIELILEAVSAKVDEDVDVSHCSIVKNNGVKMEGLCFRRRGINASPTIYMEFYYDLYKDGTELETVVDMIVETFKRNELSVDIDVDFYKDYDIVSQSLFCKIINYAQNAELMKTVPHRKFLDLAVVIYAAVENDSFGNASILVKNEHLNMWNLDEDRVFEDALSNTMNVRTYEITPMLQLLEEMGIDGIDCEEICDDGIPMYVLTNDSRYYGAIAMINKDLLREYSEQLGGDYYIIPSSVHELILLGKSQMDNVYDINAMIREVNRSQVGPEEVLSDHVYLYSQKEQVLKF